MDGPEDAFLFSPFLLRDEEDQILCLRPLHISDFSKGYAELLSQLTAIGELTSESLFIETFREWQRAGNYFVVVIEDTSVRKLIGSATVFVERKFVHNAGLTGHVEDVVVNDTYRGKNLGKRLICQLMHLARAQGCYKIVLDCAEKNVAFYEKCDFKRKEVQMAHYFPVSPKL